MALVIHDIEENHQMFDDLKKRTTGTDEELWELRLAPVHRWRFVLAVHHVGATCRDWRTIGEILNAHPTDTVVSTALALIRECVSPRSSGRRRGCFPAIADITRDFKPEHPPGSSSRLDHCLTYDAVYHHAVSGDAPRKRRRELARGRVDLCSAAPRRPERPNHGAVAHRVAPLIASVFMRMKRDASACEPLIETIVSIVHARQITECVPPSGSYTLSDSEDE
jgi:hypothetical protein